MYNVMVILDKKHHTGHFTVVENQLTSIGASHAQFVQLWWSSEALHTLHVIKPVTNDQVSLQQLLTVLNRLSTHT